MHMHVNREKIFLAFSKEIPYSCEVAVTGFKDQERLLKMNATIFTTRESHLPIIIGTKGEKGAGGKPVSWSWPSASASQSSRVSWGGGRKVDEGRKDG